MQLQFVKSALTVNPCMVSKPVMRRCGGCLQATHLLKNRGLPACKFAARFARPSKWTACSQAGVQAWELTPHFIQAMSSDAIQVIQYVVCSAVKVWNVKKRFPALLPRVLQQRPVAHGALLLPLDDQEILKFYCLYPILRDLYFKALGYLYVFSEPSLGRKGVWSLE